MFLNKLMYLDMESKSLIEGLGLLWSADTQFYSRIYHKNTRVDTFACSCVWYSCLCIWVFPCMSTHICAAACEGLELILEVSLNCSSLYIEVGSLSWTQNSPMPWDELSGGYGHDPTRCTVTWQVAVVMLTRGWTQKLFTLRQEEHTWAYSPELGFGRSSEECVESRKQSLQKVSVMHKKPIRCPFWCLPTKRFRDPKPLHHRS